MMKHSFLFILVLVFATLISCNKQERDLTFVQTLTKADTLAIDSCLERYFSFVKDEQYYEAAAMLYRLEGENKMDYQLVELDNDEMSQVVMGLRTFPFHSYDLTSLTITDQYLNEAVCTVTLFEANDSISVPNTTKMIFRPVSMYGKWYLCVKETSNGDVPVEMEADIL